MFLQYIGPFKKILTILSRESGGNIEKSFSHLNVRIDVFFLLQTKLFSDFYHNKIVLDKSLCNRKNTWKSLKLIAYA